MNRSLIPIHTPVSLASVCLSLVLSASAVTVASCRAVDALLVSASASRLALSHCKQQAQQKNASARRQDETDACGQEETEHCAFLSHKESQAKRSGNNSVCEQSGRKGHRDTHSAAPTPSVPFFFFPFFAFEIRNFICSAIGSAHRTCLSRANALFPISRSNLS